MMKISNIICTMALLSISASAIAAVDGVSGATVTRNSNETPVKEKVQTESAKETVKDHLLSHYKFYGFIRNYMAYDSREAVAGTGDLFFYLPKDQSLNAAGEDLNQKNSFRFLSLTSRVGVDVSGYQIGGTTIGAKIEADFYAGLSGVTGTATLRLRQAYLTLGWKDLPLSGEPRASVNIKMGQAWHPMAADLCPVFTLESGAPFGPFSRTPQLTMDANLGEHFTLTASALWQMQYTSAGPDPKGPDKDGIYAAVSSAEFIKYSCTPEGYLGATLKFGGWMARVGADILSIKPRTTGKGGFYETQEGAMEPVWKSTTVKVSDRITTVSPFVYMQYVKGKFAMKAKTIYASAGEHFNIQGGYGITRKFEGEGQDGHYEYTPTRSSSTWFTVSYGKKWAPMLMLGYYKNFGTAEDLYSAAGDGSVLESDFYFSKNSFKNLNQLYRICPALICNFGKLSIGLDYEFSGAQFGTPKEVESTGTDGKTIIKKYYYNSRGLAAEGLHWVHSHRVQCMVKFTF